MSLAAGLARARAARHMSVTDLVARCAHAHAHDRASMYRIVNGSVRDPRTDTLVDLCRVLRTDPTLLLQHSALWPPDAPPADAMDSALLRLLPRLEALPRAHKQWALGVVHALLAGAPSAACAPELPHCCGDD